MIGTTYSVIQPKIVMILSTLLIIILSKNIAHGFEKMNLLDFSYDPKYIKVAL